MGIIPRHVVIPTAEEPHNPSLPYVLASIRKHTDYIPVTVGKDWGLCDHIPTRQQPGRANMFTNTDLAMRIACEDDRVSPEFIWSNDDIYWTREAEPIRWAIGKLEDAQGSTVYEQRKHHTAAWLRDHGLPAYDYEAHTPMLVHKARMLTVLNHITTDPMLDKRSMYGNMTGDPDIIAPDVKLRRRSQTPTEAWYSTELPPHLYEATP